jgi:hypothetical protein
MKRLSIAVLAAFAVACPRRGLRRSVGPGLLTLLLATSACSGADASGLLGDSGSQQPQDDAAAVGPDASATEDATIVTPDADVVPDASVVVDAAPDVHVGPADSKIQCGQGSCSAQNEVCCWHQGSTLKQFECVSNASACAALDDVPITCSTTDNCASQGNAGYQCCATGGNVGWGTCSGYDIASAVACKPSCDMTDYEIGCSVQKQNCSDSMQTCVTSKCTFPGATMCY